jgi:hypothetical protein
MLDAAPIPLVVMTILLVVKVVVAKRGVGRMIPPPIPPFGDACEMPRNNRLVSELTG